MPLELSHALAAVKLARTTVNRGLGLLPQDKARAIITAAEEVVAGRHDAEFLLSV